MVAKYPHKAGDFGHRSQKVCPLPAVKKLERLQGGGESNWMQLIPRIITFVFTTLVVVLANIYDCDASTSLTAVHYRIFGRMRARPIPNSLLAMAMNGVSVM